MPQKKQKRKYVVPINKFVELIERYNRRYGTHYSYGQIQLHLSTGKILETEFYI